MPELPKTAKDHGFKMNFGNLGNFGVFGN